MIRLFRNFFGTLPLSARAIVLCYLLGLPVHLAGAYTHTFQLYPWIVLSPALVWKGEVWRLVTYGFFAANPVDCLIGTFWIATLASLMARNWTSWGFLGYCTLANVLGGAAFMLLKPAGGFYGGAAMVFALLAAWAWYHGRERVMLLAVGELSVVQAALLAAVVEVVALVFCCGCGPLCTIAMVSGGLGAWLWLKVLSKIALRKSHKVVESERISRLEV